MNSNQTNNTAYIKRYLFYVLSMTIIDNLKKNQIFSNQY